jgi:hypothetical protein
MDLTPFFMIALVVVALFLCIRWHFARSAAILQNWADENGFEILEKSHRFIFKGPFFFRTTDKQVVYRVTVRDKSGNAYTGWVACGSWWFGLLSSKARVIWDEPQEAAPATMQDRWLDA